MATTREDVADASIADYRFVERLGDGNHGTFWLAVPPPRLGLGDVEFVAVKTLAQSASDHDYTRMANELRIYAAIESDRLAPLYDAGQQKGRLFYTTRYYPDGSLGSPAKPLDQRAVVTALADSARAAHALHEAGVAHRDIKPENVMIETDAGGGARGVLGDLGLAQIINPGLTVTGIGPVGTIEYLAPEQIQGQPAGRASDVWALGVTLHRSLAGRGIYDGVPRGSLLEALRFVLSTEPAVAEELDSYLRGCIERCLKPNEADRYPTALALASDLDGWVGS